MIDRILSIVLIVTCLAAFVYTFTGHYQERLQTLKAEAK